MSPTLFKTNYFKWDVNVTERDEETQLPVQNDDFFFFF